MSQPEFKRGYYAIAVYDTVCLKAKSARTSRQQQRQRRAKKAVRIHTQTQSYFGLKVSDSASVLTSGGKGYVSRSQLEDKVLGL